MKSYRRGKKYRKTKKQMGGCLSNNFEVDHPLSPFIKKKSENKYFLVFSPKNIHKLDFDNIYIKCFITKMLDILKFSFEREKEHQIKVGNYPSNYEHSLSTVITNLKRSNYITFVATDLKLEPFSFLHIELREKDYDKMWTVCTDQQQRGKGYSSFVIKNTLKEEKRNKRNKLLLEVYNDDVIGRRDNDPRQSQIMEHFSKLGFRDTEVNSLSDYTRQNLISDTGQTRIMTCNL